jgi:hypothetical protein
MSVGYESMSLAGKPSESSSNLYLFTRVNRKSPFGDLLMSLGCWYQCHNIGVVTASALSQSDLCINLETNAVYLMP